MPRVRYARLPTSNGTRCGSIMKTITKTLTITPASAAALLLSGCVLAPKAAKDEEAALREAGRPYIAPVDRRALPDLPEAPGWEPILNRAFLANGELEAAYFDWAAAVSRIQQAGAYPNTPVALSFEYMFSGGNMKAWDRTTVT